MKDKITGIVIGLLIALCLFLGYSLYSLNKTVATDHSVLTQIVSLINQSEKAQQATPAVTSK